MLFDGDKFTHKGRRFLLRIEPDDTHGAPWEENDGHGPVSGWKYHPFGHGTKPPKAPGERILCWERSGYLTYDVAEAMRIARRDGWGLLPEADAALAQKLGRQPTRGEIVAAVVDQDFKYLRGYCNDRWQYVGVIVSPVDAPDDTESVWGIESGEEAYIEETAHELADEICARLDEILAAQIEAERPDLGPGFR